jgi:branched-chain amino acid transport system permease protein
VLGAGIALVMGAFLGMTTLRLGGHYLAMVTISFQQIVTLIMVNWIAVTHGPDGVGRIQRPPMFQTAHAFLGLCLLTMALIGYLVWRLPQTPLGRSMRAVRDNELAAGVAGINVYRTKVAAFALSALLGGIGGGLFASGFAYVSPDQFSFAESIVFITMTLLGGVASPIGALIGTALLIVLPESLRFLKSVPGLYLAIYGLSIILIIRYMADGIWGFVQHRIRRWFAPAAFVAPPAELTLTPAHADAPLALEVQSMSKHFGGLKAVDDVSFTVKRGAVHALIGPNGSGKTTILNVLSGIYVGTGGRIVLAGRVVSGLPPHARTAAGMGRTFQNIRLFRSMTALENVVIGAEHPGNAVGAGHAALIERARAALAFVGLEARAQELVTGFSYGHQRLIEIARALAGNPTLLLLDEPAAGLNSTEKLGLRDLLRRIATKGLTILIIDHDMTLVTEVAERITVLNFGRRIADGVAADVLRQPDVIAAYLGSEPDVPDFA